VSTGHAHPKVARAIAEQASTLLHVSNLYANEPALRLAGELQRWTGYDRVFLCNSGTEANEFALKVASRQAGAGGRPLRVLAAEGSFHGRTAGALTLTGQPKYRTGFPLVPGVAYVPFNDASALEAAFREPVSAVFLEAIQGEGGVRPASLDYLRLARRLCDQNGALLVLDEVQTGVGRTGRFLAQEHAAIRADVVTIAKGLGSGFPIGAVLLTRSAAELLHAGDHGCTFGGGPLASAAALATLSVLEEEHLVENADKTGEYLRFRLGAALGARAKDVRGWGLLDAVELRSTHAASVRDRAEASGLLINAIGTSILRIAPPLVVAPADVDRAVAILETIVDR
jgi:acetylornithine/succinyldiaminopimelate/putrescine aminotransferase